MRARHARGIYIPSCIKNTKMEHSATKPALRGTLSLIGAIAREVRQPSTRPRMQGCGNGGMGRAAVVYAIYVWKNREGAPRSRNKGLQSRAKVSELCFGVRRQKTPQCRRRCLPATKTASSAWRWTRCALTSLPVAGMRYVVSFAGAAQLPRLFPSVAARMPLCACGTSPPAAPRAVCGACLVMHPSLLWHGWRRWLAGTARRPPAALTSLLPLATPSTSSTCGGQRSSWTPQMQPSTSTRMR